MWWYAVQKVVISMHSMETQRKGPKVFLWNVGPTVNTQEQPAAPITVHTSV
jgi:hypothetical protein